MGSPEGASVSDTNETDRRSAEAVRDRQTDRRSCSLCMSLINSGSVTHTHTHTDTHKHTHTFHL